MADDQSIRDLEREMGVLVRRIRRVIAERARLVHPTLAPVGYSLLVALQDTGAHRASELGETFSIDKGAVSRQVSALLDLGLIERRPDPDDRRAALLQITAEGTRRLEAVSAERRREVKDRLDGWTDAEVRDLVAALGRYNAALE